MAGNGGDLLQGETFDYGAAAEAATAAPPAAAVTSAPSPYLPPAQTAIPLDAIQAPTESAGQYAADIYGASNDDMAKAFADFGVIHGAADYDQVTNDFEKSKLAVERAQRISAYRNVPKPTQALIGQWAQDIALEAAPGLKQTLIGGLAGAASGATTGLLGGPFAEVTVPAGALAGFMVGSSTVGGVTAAGQTYRAIRQRGVDHANAVPWALGAGLLEGALMNMRVKGLPGVFGEAYKRVVESSGGLPAYVQFAARFLSDIGHQASLGALQSVAGSMMEYGAAVTNNGKLPTLEETATKAAQAAINNGAIGGTFHLGGTALGSVMGKIIDQHNGKAVNPDESIDIAASQANVDSLVNEARDYQAILAGITQTVEERKVKGEVIPPALMQAYTDAQDQLIAAEAKSKAAMDAHKAKIEFNAMPVDERLKAAEEQRKQADNHLSNIQYQIEASPDPDNPPPDLIAARKQARIDLRIATERKRQAELEIERESLQTKAASDQATPAARAAKSSIERIDKELHKIKISEVERQLKGRQDYAQHELDNVQNEITNREKEGEPTDKLKAREEKLRSRLESIKVLQELLRDDALSYEDVDNLRVKVPLAKVEYLAYIAKLLASKTAKQAAGDTLRDTKADFKLVERVIRLSGLSKAEQSKLKQFQPGTSLAKYIDYLYDRIAEIIEKREGKEAEDALADALKKTQPQVINKTLRGYPTVQAALTLYRRLIENPKDAEAIRDREISDDEIAKEPELTLYRRLIKNPKDAEAIRDRDISDDEIAKEPELGALHPFTMKAIAAEVLQATTPEAITDLAEHIEKIAKDGLDAKLQAAQDHAKRGNAHVATLLSAMPDNAGKSFDNESLAVQIKRASGDLVMAPWNILVETLAQFADDATKAKFRKALEVRRAVDKTQADIHELNRQLFSYITQDDAKLKAELIKGYAKPAAPRKGAPNNELANATDDRLMRVLGAMYEAIATKNNVMRSRLIQGNKFTLYGENSTVKWVESQLSDTQIEMVKRTSEFYRDVLYPKANKAHIEKFGYPLEFNPHYSGPAQALLEDTTNNDFLKAVLETRSTAPGFLKRREINVHPLPLDVGMLDNAKGYIRGLSKFEAFTKETDSELSAGERLQAIGNLEVQKRIRHVFGEKVLKMVNDARNDITGVKPIIVKHTGLIGGFIKGVTGVIHSPFQLIKQSTGVLMYLKYENVADLAWGVHEVVTNFEKYSKIFNGMDFLKARERSGTKTGLVQLEARLENARKLFGDNAVKNGIMVLQELQAMPLELADKWNILLGGGALYALERKRGATHEQAESYMAKASVETQGSSLIDQKTSLERTELGAALSQFSKPAVQAHFAAAADIRNLIAHPSAKNAWRAAASSFAVRVAETSFVSAGAVPGLLTALLLADRDNQSQRHFERVAHDFAISYALAATLGPATGLPNLSNQILNMVYKAALNAYTHGQAHEYETQIAILEMATSFGSLANEAFNVGAGNKALTREEQYTITRAFNRSFIMGSTGLNAAPLIDTYFFLMNISEDPIDRMIRKSEDRQEQQFRKRERELEQ